MNSKIDPLVSVIVTTKNEERHISACLGSVVQQSNPPLEIILVDNFSKDKTIEIAKQYGTKIFQQGPERSAQRNYGVEKAQGKYILYLDADMRLTPKVIEECVNCCETDNKICGIYIPEFVVGKGFWIKVRRFERSFYEDRDLKPNDSLLLMFSFKHLGTYSSTNLAVSETDKQDIRWISSSVDDDKFN